jgi:putative glutathione S-transferase
MLNSEFRGIAGDDTDYYPEPLRAEIDRINDFVYANVNNGVYRCGFAKSQAAYDDAFDGLFAALDGLEKLLSQQPTLAGNQITEADWRLLPTLLRFDVVYFSLFKCNRQRIADYPALSRYMQRLIEVPGVAPTINARYYVLGYYSNTNVNPTGVIPRGTPVNFVLPESRSAA